MIRALWIFPCSCLVAILAGPAYGGRPLTTEDAGVPGACVSQVEVSGEYARKADGEQDYAVLFVPIYGLTNRTEFSVEIPYKFKRLHTGGPTEGLEDIALVLKSLIFDKGGRSPAFLVKTAAKLNTGDRERDLGSGDTDLGFIAVISQGLPPFTLHSNLGYTFVGTAGDPALRNYLVYGLAGEYSFGDRLTLVGELYGESDSHHDIGAFAHHNPQALIGMTYTFSERIVCDAAIKAGGEHEGFGYGMTAGMTITF